MADDPKAAPMASSGSPSRLTEIDAPVPTLHFQLLQQRRSLKAILHDLDCTGWEDGHLECRGTCVLVVAWFWPSLVLPESSRHRSSLEVRNIKRKPRNTDNEEM